MVMHNWQQFFKEEQSKAYYQKLINDITAQRNQGEVIYPPQRQVFNAFEATPLSDIKVVILGQDPYHGPNQAHGLAFSVLPNVKVPPSLKNIYKELATDIDGFTIPEHGYLQNWAAQGVLLLNTVLTVKQAQAHSHAKLGWETFTDAVIAYINEHNSGCVFMLWGGHAKKKGKNIDSIKHYILTAPHPSPLSVYRGFYGCQHFSMANDWLKKHHKTPVNWELPLIMK